MNPPKPDDLEFAHRSWSEEDLEKLREFLSKEKMDDINDALSFYHTAKSVGRFNAWLIAGVVGVIITFSAFGEAIRKMLSWIGKS